MADKSVAPTPGHALQSAVACVAWRVVDKRGNVSLHHDRARAEQACVDRGGTLTELVERIPAQPSDDYLLVMHAFAIANAFAIAEIEMSTPKEAIGPFTWHDTKSLSGKYTVIDYGVSAGLFIRHPVQKHLIRIVKK